MGEKKQSLSSLWTTSSHLTCISEVLKEERENVAQTVLEKKSLKIFCHWWKTSAYKFKQPSKYKKG